MEIILGFFIHWPPYGVGFTKHTDLEITETVMLKGFDFTFLLLRLDFSYTKKFIEYNKDKKSE